MKKCSECGEEKEETTEFFYKRKTAKDGLSGACKACIKARSNAWRESNVARKKASNKAWYQANSDRLSANAKEYRATNLEETRAKDRAYSQVWCEENYDKIKVYRREYYKENRNTIDTRNKAWHQANPDRVKDFKKVWREANPWKDSPEKLKWRRENSERIAATGKAWQQANPKRRQLNYQKRRSLEKHLPATLTLKQWTTAMNHFNNCCAYCGKEEKLTQDHFVPLSKSGEYSESNIIPACQSCNSSKGVSPFSVWYPGKPFYTKNKEDKILKYLGYENRKQQLNIF